ncbi:unnamed protein product, partial [marine sediment metagenome]
GCNKPDTYLCQVCFTRLDSQDKIEIEKNKYLNKIITATSYKDPFVRELIKKFKYNYIKELAKPLSQLLIKSMTQCWIPGIPHNNTIVVPIPLYGTRMRKRGFNQAELIAKEIANHFNLCLETNILIRKISTEPQANIKDDKKRKANIKGVFKINPSSLNRIRDGNIILVDDVATTNATLSEAAKILKKSGAKEVWGTVVAKG